MAHIHYFIENNTTGKRIIDGIRHTGSNDEMKSLWRKYWNEYKHHWWTGKGSAFGVPYMYYVMDGYVYELTLHK